MIIIIMMIIGIIIELKKTNPRMGQENLSTWHHTDRRITMLLAFAINGGLID
jgi:hypothetical protein